MDQMDSLELDFDILKRISQDRIVRILEEANGPKDLIIDGGLMKLLDRIANAVILREHGVGKMFRFERIPPSINTNQLVYFIQPSLQNIKVMIDHIHNFATQVSIQYHLICVPRATFSVMQLLEEEGVYDLVKVHEFWTEFIPLDDDYLSLEMSDWNTDVFLNGDLSSCVPIAKALNTFQSFYGHFSYVVGHGKASASVVSLVQKFDQERRQTGRNKNCKMGFLFVLDREADYVTPLLTQLTYEGTLDEQYGIRAGVVELPKEVTGENQALKVALNSKDTIFDNIRNKHFAGVSSHLVRKAKDLQEKKKATTTMSTTEMKSFVNNDLRTLQTLQKSLSLHISFCEDITKRLRKDFDTQLVTEHGLVTGGTSQADAKSYIIDCMARQLPSVMVLRLLCLYSITQKGIPKKDYEFFTENFLKAYGYHHLITLHRLKQMDLLLIADGGVVEKDSSDVKQQLHGLRQAVSSLVVRKSNHWAVLTKKLGLIPDPEQNIDLHNPTHISYVYNGAYAPLIPQLISNFFSTKSLDNLLKNLKFLPGSTSTLFEGESTEWPRVAFVLILGGITFAEIAALRLVAAAQNVKIIIASTITLTGSTLLKPVIASR